MPAGIDQNLVKDQAKWYCCCNIQMKSLHREFNMNLQIRRIVRTNYRCTEIYEVLAEFNTGEILGAVQLFMNQGHHRNSALAFGENFFKFGRI